MIIYSLYVYFLSNLLSYNFIRPIGAKKFGSTGRTEEEDLSLLLEDEPSVVKNTFTPYTREAMNLPIEKKMLKLQACSVLSRERVTRDLEYVQLVASFVNPNSDENESISQVLSLMLMSCFKNIDYSKAELISEQKEQNLLNPMTLDNKALLELDKWEDIYLSNNEKLIQEEVYKYSDVMRDMKAAQSALLGENNKNNQSNQESNQEKKANYNEDDEESEFYNTGKLNNKPDLVLFGYEINKLAPNTKLILGVSLLVLIFVALFIAVKSALSELPTSKEKKSKKVKKHE